jgi:hypothetical protein
MFLFGEKIEINKTHNFPTRRRRALAARFFLDTIFSPKKPPK